MKGDRIMKKTVLIIVAVLIAVLIIVGVVFGISANNNHSDPSKKPGSSLTDDGEKTEPEEVKIDFFGEFEPFECNGDYTSFSYISVVTDQDGTRFYSKSSEEKGKHNDTLMYVLPSGEERMLFMLGKPDSDIEVMSVIDNALYFNITNSDEDGINGLYRMLLDHNEAGEVSNGGITLRFNLNLEPMRAKDNTLLLRKGEQYYLFDTQTGECEPYN